MENNSPINIFSKNLKVLRKRRKRTQDDVAFALNMKRSTLSGYENDFSAPSIENLIAISDYYKLPIDTLLRFDLEKTSESQLSEIERSFDSYIKGRYLRILATTVDAHNEENIELVPEKAKAGYTRGFADSEYIKELPVFQLPFLTKFRKYRSFQISGDSMLPIPDGTFVTGEFVTDWSEVKSETANIFVTKDDGIVFKIAENRLQTEEAFILHSLNPLYEPYKLPVTEITEIWKFTNYISNELPDTHISNDDMYATVASIKFDLNKIKAKMQID